jgi:hypothetical protein
MMKKCGWILIVIAGHLILMAGQSYADENHVTMTVGNVTISARDTNLVVPVYFTNAVDKIAGVEFQVKLDQNHYVEFNADGGTASAVDTAGTLVSGWEWIGVSSIDKTPFDIKFAGLADWPGGKINPPLAPQEDGILVKLRIRVKSPALVPAGEKIGIHISPDKTGFSDPIGNSIGIKTEMVRKCREFRGDSCISWRMVKIATLDTVAVRLIDGSITFSDSLKVGVK